MSAPSTSGYGKHYSNSGFWNKVKKVAKFAGKNVIRPALILYYVMMRPETPAWAKAIVIAALGYFICPVDAIPDILVPVGYVDDAAVLAAASATVASYIDGNVMKEADNQLTKWFGK